MLPVHVGSCDHVASARQVTLELPFKKCLSPHDTRTTLPTARLDPRTLPYWSSSGGQSATV